MKHQKRLMIELLATVFFVLYCVALVFGTCAFNAALKEFGARATAAPQTVTRARVNDSPPKASPPKAPQEKPTAKKPRPKKSRKQASVYTITFYCPCAKCCGKTDGITASGKKARVHHTIAAPKSFAFGTRIKIEGLGTYTVDDRGGSIKGKRLDVYVESHEEALKLGKQQRKVWVVR